jgi:hypothetical protein
MTGQWERATQTHRIRVAVVAIVIALVVLPHPSAALIMGIRPTGHQKFGDNIPVPLEQSADRVVVVEGTGVDFALDGIIVSNPVGVRATIVLRKNGFQNDNKGQGLIHIRFQVDKDAAPGPRKVTLVYPTGQSDDFTIDVHSFGRIEDVSPRQVPFNVPIPVVISGKHLLSAAPCPDAPFAVVSRPVRFSKPGVVDPSENVSQTWILRFNSLGGENDLSFCTRDEAYGIRGKRLPTRKITVIGGPPRPPAAVPVPITSCTPTPAKPTCP